jgi:hypothetical protein
MDIYWDSSVVKISEAGKRADVFDLNWRVYKGGYSLTKAPRRLPPGAPASAILLQKAQTICRDGGIPEDYRPTEVLFPASTSPPKPLHRYFAAFGTGPNGELTAGDAFRFVQNFGFVTVPADAQEEPVSAIIECHRALWVLCEYEKTAASMAQSAGVDGAHRRYLGRHGRPIRQLADAFNKWTAPLKMKVEVDADNPTHPRLQVRPVTLGAWMVLQYARELIGDVSYPLCKQCGQPFPVEAKPGPFPETCSDRCRKARSRARMKRRMKGRKI